MWRLHRPLNSLWTLLVVWLVGSVVIEVMGNCAYDELFTPRGCTLTSNPLNLMRPSILVVIAALFLILGLLRLIANRSYRRHEALKHFALLKPVEKLSPEDFGFQVLRPGEQPDTYKRPFYPIYIPRRAVEEGEDPRYVEDELAEALWGGKSFVLLGQPLDGKSRTLYEVIGRMHGRQVVKPSSSKGMPYDDDFSLIKGEKVIVVLEDLHHYVGRQVDLPEFYEKLQEHASSCVVAATCRDGPEQRLVETNLGRFYEEIDLKLSLALPTIEDNND